MDPIVPPVTSLKVSPISDQAVSQLPKGRKKQPGVYKVTNTLTGETYVGSTIDLKGRWYSHRLELRNGKHRNIKLQAAWKQYGEEAFSHSILEKVDSYSLLPQREQFYILLLKPAYNSEMVAKLGPVGRRMTDQDDDARFWNKVEKQQDGCWLWKGSYATRPGAKPSLRFRTAEGNIAARRYAYEKIIGPISKNEQIRQGCSEIFCINPFHSRIVIEASPTISQHRNKTK